MKKTKSRIVVPDRVKTFSILQAKSRQLVSGKQEVQEVVSCEKCQSIKAYKESCYLGGCHDCNLAKCPEHG